MNISKMDRKSFCMKSLNSIFFVVKRRMQNNLGIVFFVIIVGNEKCWVGINSGQSSILKEPQDFLGHEQALLLAYNLNKMAGLKTFNILFM